MTLNLLSVLSRRKPQHCEGSNDFEGEKQDFGGSVCGDAHPAEVVQRPVICPSKADLGQVSGLLLLCFCCVGERKGGAGNRGGEKTEDKSPEIFISF